MQATNKQTQNEAKRNEFDGRAHAQQTLGPKYDQYDQLVASKMHFFRLSVLGTVPW